MVQKGAEGVLVALGLALAERRRSIGVNRLGNERVDGQCIVERKVGRPVDGSREILSVGAGICLVQAPCDLHEPAALHFSPDLAFDVGIACKLLRQSIE